MKKAILLVKFLVNCEVVLVTVYQALEKLTEIFSSQPSPV